MPAASSPSIVSNIAFISAGSPGKTYTFSITKPGRAAERVLDPAAADRQLRPARRVLGVAREARAQRVGELRDELLLHAESRRERLARQVVGRAAEAAGDEDEVDVGRLAPDEARDRVDLVGHRGERSRTLTPSRSSRLREPRRRSCRRRRPT